MSDLATTRHFPAGLFSVDSRPWLVLVWVFIACAPQGDSTTLDGPFLGQKPPAKVAEVFAPGVVSTDADEVLFEVFNDGTLIFFERKALDFDEDWIHAPVYRVEMASGEWAQPQRATTTGRPWFYEYPDAPEGTVVAFPWRKNLNGSGEPLDIDLWRVVKTSKDWEEPQRFGPPINTDSFDSWPSLARNDTLYFFSTREGGLGRIDIYRSIPQNGEYVEAENLGKVINTEFNDHDPFIAPDEGYLLFCSDRPGGLGGNDLFVSYRAGEGSWTTPINLGAGINTAAHETRPYVTPDGKYLFFNSTTSGSKNIYWVDATILGDFE